MRKLAVFAGITLLCSVASAQWGARSPQLGAPPELPAAFRMATRSPQRELEVDTTGLDPSDPRYQQTPTINQIARDGQYAQLAGIFSQCSKSREQMMRAVRTGMADVRRAQETVRRQAARAKLAQAPKFQPIATIGIPAPVEPPTVYEQPARSPRRAGNPAAPDRTLSDR